MKSIHISLITFITGLGAAFAQLPTASESPILDHSQAGERPTVEWGVQNCTERAFGDDDQIEAPFFENCEFMIRRETEPGVFQDYLKILPDGRLQQKIETNVTTNIASIHPDELRYSVQDDFGDGTVSILNSFQLKYEVTGNQVKDTEVSANGVVVNDVSNSFTTEVRAEGIVTPEIETAKWKISSISDGPDFVFLPDYQLKPLDELEKHIEEHGHLPEIPSADEMKEEGVDMVELNMKLLQKIEEMTLYIMDQEKRIQKLERKNEE